MLETKPMARSWTMWGGVMGSVAAVLTYVSAVLGRHEVPDPWICGSLLAGGLSSVVGAVAGRWRGGPRLRARGGRSGAGLAVLLCCWLMTGCSGQLDALGALGSAVAVGQAGCDCADVDIDLQVPSSAADVVTVQQVLRALSDLAVGRDAQYESDLVRVVLTGCGRRLEVYLAAGVAVGRAVVGLTPPDH